MASAAGIWRLGACGNCSRFPECFRSLPGITWLKRWPGLLASLANLSETCWPGSGCIQVERMLQLALCFPPLFTVRILMMTNARSCVAVTLFLLVGWPGVERPMLQAEDWARFRGPRGNGSSTDASVPTQWSDSQNLKWKLRLPGAGFSSPIVVGDRVFVTAY